MNVVFYVLTANGKATRCTATHVDHASAIRKAEALKMTAGVSCVWIGSRRYGSMSAPSPGGGISAVPAAGGGSDTVIVTITKGSGGSDGSHMVYAGDEPDDGAGAGMSGDDAGAMGDAAGAAPVAAGGDADSQG